MCLGLPGRVVALTENGRLGQVEVAGVIRLIDLSLLPQPPAPGDYLLVHSGVALELLPPQQASEAAAWFRSAPVSGTDPPAPASAPEPGTGPLLRDEGTQQQ